ncbi:MAG: hypothetical protein ACLUW6_00330 [Coriobacteriaceae bacterium]
MKLVVTEKNDAAVKIADLLGASSPKPTRCSTRRSTDSKVEGRSG